MVVYDQELLTEITVGDDEWLCVDGNISRSRYNEVDTVQMLAVPDPNENEDAVPEEGDEIIVKLGPRSSVTDEGERDFVNGDLLVTVFTGYVTNVFDFGDGSWEIEAVNYMLDLKTTNVYISVDTYIKTSKLIEEVVSDVNLFAGIDLDYNINLSPTIAQPFGYSRWHSSGEIDDTTDELISREFTGVKAAKVLDELSEAANAIWWIDANNTLQFGPTNTAGHKLSWVTETSAGKQTPPYKSVKIVGDNVVSKEGWAKSQMLSESTGVAQASLESLGIEDTPVGAGGLVPPTFVYRNESIKTQEEANKIRNRILDELQQQQAGGHVTIVGRPMIDILDVIEMPDSFGRTSTSPAGDAEFVEPAQYIVQKVEHRLNGSDGYTTRIECGGLAATYDGAVYEFNEAGNLILSTQEESE